MPTPAEEKFLVAFTQYVDFRLSQGVKRPAGNVGARLVRVFKEFLKSHGAESGERFDFLVEKMTNMKESGGTGQPPPKVPRKRTRR